MFGRATPRILLFYIAIVLKLIAAALAAIGFVLKSGPLMVSGTVFWVLFFAVLLFITVPSSDQRFQKHLQGLKKTARAIVISLLVLAIALVAFIAIVGLDTFFNDDPESGLSELLISLDNVFGYNDATSLSHQAAQNLLDGKNPYEDANIIAAMIEYHGEIDKITPLREGRFADVFPYPTMEQLERFWEDVNMNPDQIPVEVESRFNYPAGGFLLPAPFLAIGLSDLRYVFLILLIPVIVYVIWKTPSRYRIHLVIGLMASLELWLSLASGETGFLYFPFLFFGWILYKKNWWASAILLAVAIVIKQLAWFVLPFYLILMFRTRGWQQMVFSLLIIAGIFFAVNGYFIAQDPELWINSVGAPVSDNMFPLGVGIISLVSGGYLDIQSPLIFTILEMAVAVAAVLWYFFKGYRYPEVGLLLAVLPLFFAWRSLWGYFFYIDVIILASILINEYGLKKNDDNGGLIEIPSG